MSRSRDVLELSKMTMADYAEAWAKSQGMEVPPRDSDEWELMYEKWHAYAFADFSDQP